MRKSIPRLLSLVLLASFVAPATAQEASARAADKPIAPGEFRISWSIVDSTELELAAKEREMTERRAKLGNIPPETLEVQRLRYEQLYRSTPRLLTIRSGGGPLSAFVAAASKDPERTFNLINAGDPADLETPLPPFSLRNVNWGTIIGVLDSFLAPRGLNLRFVGGDSPNPGEAKSVVCVLRHTDSRTDSKHSLQPEFESFQLGEHINGNQTIEVIVDAIRTAWELDPSHDAAALRLKFHPGTKMLLISGPAPATFIARQVIGGLRKNPVVR